MDAENIVALTITEAYNSDEVICTLLCNIGFTVNGINQLIRDKGVLLAKEILFLKPKGFSDALENVNCLFGNKTGNNRIYFNVEKIINLQGLSDYFRICKTANRTPIST